jgi:murein DD-endopeptidase MepM/ murein hydrolase activator NlpD
MKSGILATTTLLVILGTVEQVQAQTETDRDHEYDFTEFSYGSDPTPAATAIAEENNQNYENNQYVSLAWQTDFTAKSSSIAQTEELASLSPVPELQTPLLADLRMEQTDQDRADWSNKVQPHVPPRTATPVSRTEESFRERTNPSRAAIANYRDDNLQKFGVSSIATPPTLPEGARSIATPLTLREMSALSSQPVNQPEIPPLAAATLYLPDVQPDRPVFNGYGWPAQGVITSHYGWRWGRMHSGIDIAGPIGTPIVAAADGVVITSEWHSGGYGNLVEIEHPDGSITLYGHNSEIRVSVGEVVKQGQLIALMGSTGYSTGPHLHFEVLLPGQGAVNPSAYLPSGDSVAHQHW